MDSGRRAAAPIGPVLADLAELPGPAPDAQPARRLVTPPHPGVVGLLAGLPQRRRLAVLLADVAGYTRLMEDDEVGTWLRLRAIKRDIIRPAVARHGGWIVNAVGDRLLVGFARSPDALACAVRFQHDIAARNRGCRAFERLWLRAGIHVADVLVDVDDVCGDGVNVAARLETLAAPGGICVSQALCDDLGAAADRPFMVDGGVPRLKNLHRAIRVFHVLMQADEPAFVTDLQFSA